METILDCELVNQEVEKTYNTLSSDQYPCLFLGYIIKNRYDERRYSICESLNPIRFSYPTSSKLNFYGVVSNRQNNFLSELQAKQPLNLNDYSSFCVEQDMSCYSCFLYFFPYLYPVDSTHRERFFPNINIESFYINDNNIPIYQRVGSLYMFAFLDPKS